MSPGGEHSWPLGPDKLQAPTPRYRDPRGWFLENNCPWGRRLPASAGASWRKWEGLGQASRTGMTRSAAAEQRAGGPGKVPTALELPSWWPHSSALRGMRTRSQSPGQHRPEVQRTLGGLLVDQKWPVESGRIPGTPCSPCPLTPLDHLLPGARQGPGDNEQLAGNRARTQAQRP